MLVWKKSANGFQSGYFIAPIVTQASWMGPGGKVANARLYFRVERERYQKTWQAELVRFGQHDAHALLAKSFRTAKEAMKHAESLLPSLGAAIENPRLTRRQQIALVAKDTENAYRVWHRNASSKSRDAAIARTNLDPESRKRRALYAELETVMRAAIENDATMDELDAIERQYRKKIDAL